MLSKIKALPKLAAALAVAAALTFGTTQALADVDCTPLPEHTCVGNPGMCWQFCIENQYEGGQCLIGQDCCICLEK